MAEERQYGEDSGKGPAAKHVREKDPARGAQLTAKVHHGTVESYSDFPQNKFDSGHGFIVPHDKVSRGAPERYIFHRRSIQTPDKAGGIQPRTRVTFSIESFHSGTRLRAVAVTTTCPPGEYKDWIFINSSFDDFEEEYGISSEALEAVEVDENRDAGQEAIYRFVEDNSWV